MEDHCRKEGDNNLASRRSQDRRIRDSSTRYMNQEFKMQLVKLKHHPLDGQIRIDVLGTR